MAQLPVDPVEIEQVIVSAIRDVFMSVPLVAQFAKVQLRERFPDSDEDDIELSTVDDPGNSSIRFTSVIQIGIPRVAENPYTSERCTQLDLEYPITFDMGVVDEWDNADNSLDYTNSRALFMAIYMRARAAFAASKILGAFENCEHDYLQLESVATVEDEETGGHLHCADMSLMVHVKGITV